MRIVLGILIVVSILELFQNNLGIIDNVEDVRILYSLVMQAS